VAETASGASNEREPGADGAAAVVARNREQQAALYGEPLGDLLAKVIQQLGVSQARIARVLGLSPPMLSQLASGHRIKIGNPVAVHRLQALVALAGSVAAGRVGTAEISAQLAEIASQAAVVTQTTTLSGSVPSAAAVRTVQGLFRAVAGAEDYLAAAAAIEGEHPGIAHMLRVYGAGRTHEAITDFESYAHLI
jgi:predicted transcriptional regulator